MNEIDEIARMDPVRMVDRVILVFWIKINH